MKRVLLIGTLLAVGVILYLVGASDYLSFDYLKREQSALQYQIAENYLGSRLLFFILYVATTAASLPGAAVLTLAAGALFGFWQGLLLVSFASTLGATLAFLVSRLFLRSYVQKTFAEKLATINRGIEREGAFYLFSLRLIPLFPFFVINLLFGLTSLRPRTFFWVSQLGMLPGTMAYVNAGTQLSSLDSMSGILSWNVLLSFIVLGLVPLVAKRSIVFYQQRKVMRRFSRPRKFDYNLVVIGAGSAGLVSAYIAAATKAKVALVERHKMGGDCLNTGCVPSKALIRSAKVLSLAKRAADFGFDSAHIEFEFAKVMERVQSIISRIEPHDSVERYTALGVECVTGEARITSPYTVQVGDRELRTRAIVVATGAAPTIPNIPGLDQVEFLTSDTIWNLRELPKRLLILGGGPIGVELAQAFARFGSAVTVVGRASRLLPKEDPDVSTVIEQQFKSEGITVLTGTVGKEFRKTDRDQQLIVESIGGAASTIAFDKALIVVGRTARTKAFGLDELGIELSEQGTIEHDPWMRTSVPNILVCGDVAGPYQFTHTASYQAWFASLNALLAPFWKFRTDYRAIPWCTFCDPEVARVGLTEGEAKKLNIPHQVTVYPLDDLDRAITESATTGFVKVLTQPNSDRILGATIVGEHAGDLIIEFISAIKHDLGLNKILGTIHIYPTFVEGNKFAAGRWKQTAVSARARSLAEWFLRKQRGT